MFLTVIALRILFSTDKSLMLAKEALLISEATIMRCPEFVVGIISSRVISTLALRLVEL